MRSKTLLICLFVGSFLILGVLFLENGSSSPVTASTTKPTATELVATQDLTVGTLLRAEDVKWEPVEGTAAPDAIVRQASTNDKASEDADARFLSQIYGSVVRQRIAADNPVSANALVKPGDRGFLAAVLAPGYRAITISVTAVSGTAGLIFPGDHVDVILTQTFNQNDTPLARRSVAETIVSNIRVVAIDQRVQQVALDPSKTDIPIARTVTLQALPKQAEMITVATELGKLSLTLRSAPNQGVGDVADAQQLSQPIWASDVSHALGQPAAKAQVAAVAPPIRIIRGGKIEQWAR